MSKLRSIIFGSARLLGDIRAIATGTIGFRIAKRVAGKVASVGIKRILKKKTTEK